MGEKKTSSSLGTYLFLRLNIMLRKIFNPDAARRGFPDLEADALRVEQVADGLLVDLQEGALDDELGAVGSRLDVLEDVLAAPWDDPRQRGLLRVRSEHREGLSGARLSVREDGPVVPSDHVLDRRPRHVLVDLLLPRGSPAEDPVQPEGVLLLPVVGLAALAVAVELEQLRQRPLRPHVRLLLQLPLVHWPEPAAHSDRVARLRGICGEHVDQKVGFFSDEQLKRSCFFFQMYFVWVVGKIKIISCLFSLLSFLRGFFFIAESNRVPLLNGLPIDPICQTTDQQSDRTKAAVCGRRPLQLHHPIPHPSRAFPRLVLGPSNSIIIIVS